MDGYGIEGHKFIVTGAAKGIGLAISQRLSALGAKVSGWDLNDEIMSIESTFTQKVQFDVTDENSVRN